MVEPLLKPVYVGHGDDLALVVVERRVHFNFSMQNVASHLLCSSTSKPFLKEAILSMDVISSK